MLLLQMIPIDGLKHVFSIQIPPVQDLTDMLRHQFTDFMKKVSTELDQDIQKQRELRC